jgi:hypothetical protein
MFRETPAVGRARRITFNSEGFHMESEDARGEYKWTLFLRIIETRKVFVFMQTTKSGTYIPKRCLSNPQDILALRQLIRANFTGKKTLRVD